MEIGRRIRLDKLGRSVTSPSESEDFHDRKLSNYYSKYDKGYYQPEKGYK